MVPAIFTLPVARRGLGPCVDSWRVRHYPVTIRMVPFILTSCGNVELKGTIAGP
jgi:hypothetical protein